MNKFISIILIFTVAIIGLSSCKDEDRGVEKLHSELNVLLSYGDRDVSTDVVSQNMAMKQSDDFSIFEGIANEVGMINYVKLGTTISIKFEDEPKSIKMKGYILKKDGTVKFDSNTIENVNIKYQDGIGSFTLEENFAVALSSNWDDYGQAAVYRGFICTSSWEEYTQKYYFILNTDPFCEDSDI